MITQFKNKREMVEAITQRDGDQCYLCDKDFTERDPLTIDHYIPLSKGGTWDLDNLKIAHKSCNVRKGNRLFVNGQLESPPRKPSYHERRVAKQRALDNLCNKCNNGRLLNKYETCNDCGRAPGGTLVPQYLWRQPKQCDHDKFACWLCFIDIVPRKSAIEKLLIG